MIIIVIRLLSGGVIMKKITTILTILLVMLISAEIYGQFAGGSGTEDDPYLIETATHLNNVRNELQAYFKQISDIDLDVAPYNEGSGWEPIGASGATFGGHYDGDRFIISNLFINKPEENNIGLFGYSQEATIKNLAITGANVTGNRWVGVLAGDFSGSDQVSGSIINCSTHGTVSGHDRVGGLAGFVIRSSVTNCHSDVNVTGLNTEEIGAGGLVGFISTDGMIENSYATGSVTASNNGTHVGGLIGRGQSATITNCYATGEITAQTNVGGLIGNESQCTTTNSYWDTQTSGQNNSAGGHGRTSDQMTYPFGEDTYVTWDFERIWVTDSEINDGYPFLFNQSGLNIPNPTIAVKPQPAHDSTGVSIDLEQVEWSYILNKVYAKPLGFRVYFNTTGEFDDDDPFTWVPYVENQENYQSADILPEELSYGATYYWKVIPTTIDPGRSGNRRRNTYPDRSSSSYRGDAENVPVWNFTVETSDNPYIATNPSPANDSTDVVVDLEYLAWSYHHHQGYTEPIGFRLYFNDSGEFNTNDPFEWIAYSEDQTDYQNSDILPETLAYDTTYYWKVVPTTIDPGRGDADNVPVWSFTTLEVEPNPVPAINPAPSNREMGVPLDLEKISWDYESHEYHADPIGFRVYFGTSPNFEEDAPFIWVYYDDDVVNYHLMLDPPHFPELLESETVYYWQVVPTTVDPEGKTNNKPHNNQSPDSRKQFLRGDAENVLVWRFTTGMTNIDDDLHTPETTQLIGNYPNPFNPETNISFFLEEESLVTIEIFDIKGAKIASLINEHYQSGYHSLKWSGKDDNNNHAGSGIYFYRMNSSSINNSQVYTKTKKMILLK